MKGSTLTLMIVLVATALTTLANADTQQDFDSVGSAYVLAQYDIGPPPIIVSGGPTGSYMRLVSAACQRETAIRRPRIASRQDRNSTWNEETAHHLPFCSVPEPIAELLVECLLFADPKSGCRIPKRMEFLFMIVDGCHRLEDDPLSIGRLHLPPRCRGSLVESLITFPDTRERGERPEVVHDRFVGHRFPFLCVEQCNALRSGDPRTLA